ncbi:putative Permease of the major facilitator superfamily [Vibrio nigripulchritudo MADA3029]|uniref:MFS transporter n=1 Tax=Vibrio nigripulchritudo TaxID=28173 RepID=UPI0003B205E3|nr:MFS transporter [Vibrio nigripulchritudo]CCN47348.1 putative Permease of the major facilitator superfamily [Vibrio nigripulchritudo MADA3020]CCN55213.1 putative Permease of the major facilitator superfamily [Vibrio nigripulchritudo MADA3021]CCN60992.1 putative Permease of the major facilitator superfamily [Vibrio nigripulchritudo MADA3029]
MRNKTLPYLAGRFFDGISSGLFMMALPWIILSEPDMGTFVAMTALVCTTTSFLATPFFSTLIDRHSRKAILVIIQAIQASTAALVCIAYSFDLGSHWLLATAQLVFWVSSNLAWVTNNAFTQENYESHEYASISGYQEIILQGTTLGAGALGVILLERWGMWEFSLFAAIASGIATVAYLATPYIRKLRKTQKRSFTAQLTESVSIFRVAPRFYAFIMLSCLSYPILTFLGKLVPIWFAEAGISGDWLAAYNISFGLGSLFTGFLVSRVLRQFSHQAIMQYSMFIVASMLFGMALYDSPLYLVLFTLGFGFFNALNRIARTNWLHHTVEVSQRGRVDGGLVLFSTLVQSLSYTLIAVLSHYDITRWGFVIAAVLVLVAAVLMNVLNSNDQFDQRAVPQS